MRKNFFKKLSFVMALAMIVSLIAPAAGVFADTGLSLNSTNKYLHLSGKPGKNKYNFNINGDKQKGWKYLWTSSNEDVAEVNPSNGVTVAKGVGTAKITVVITDKKGAEVDRLTAKVTVRDNIETVKIAEVPDRALAVGEEYDFNRTFTTLSGSTTKTSSVTRWFVEGENSDKATINDENGLFVASEAGKYTVVARSFQSKAKYEDWKTSKNDDLVLATDKAEITVKASIKEVKQYDLTKFTVEFNADMRNAGLTKDTVKVAKIVNGKDVETGAEKVKDVSFSDDGKTVTVELYAEFSQETEYKFTFGEFVDTFKSAKVDLSLVKEIDFKDVNVNIESTGSKLIDSVVGKNADGVIIFKGDTSNGSNEFNGYLSFELAADYDISKVYLDSANSILYIYDKGYEIPVTAKFVYYHFNTDTNQVETISATDTAIAKGVKVDGVLVTSSLQYAVAKSQPNSNDSKWGVGPFKLAADDDGYQIFLRYKTMEQASWEGPKVDTGRFVFESTNTDKLLVQGTYVYPVAPGTVTVLVKDSQDNFAVVGAFEVTIAAARDIASAIPESQLVVANNNLEFGTNGEVTKIVVTDTLGDPAEHTKLTVTSIDKKYGPDDLGMDFKVLDQWYNAGKIAVIVDARGAAAGNYQYKYTVAYKNSKREVTINIQVKEGQHEYKDPDALKVVRWALELSKSDFDLKDVDAPQTLNYGVYGYNKNNVKVAALSTSQYDLKIEKDGEEIKADVDKNSFNFVKSVSSLEVAGKTLSGSYLSLKGTGTYVVTATVAEAGKDATGKANGAIIGRLTFTLKDSTKITADFTPVVNAGSVMKMVQDAYKFYINDEEVADSDIVAVKYAIGSGVKTDDTVVLKSGESIIVKEVYVLDKNGVVRKYTTNASLKAK